MDRMHGRFRRGAGPALTTLAVLLGCAVALGQTLSACYATFALDPSGGSTIPGGHKMFMIDGITRKSCDWLVKPTLDSGPAGVTVTFQPAGGFILPAHKIASGSATVNVGTSVAPGTYALRIKLNLTRSFGGVSEPAPPQYFTYTLQVLHP